MRSGYWVTVTRASQPAAAPLLPELKCIIIRRWFSLLIAIFTVLVNPDTELYLQLKPTYKR